MHTILAREFLKKLEKVINSKLLTCKGVLISNALGACHCLLTVPIASLGEINQEQRVKLVSCMHGQLDRKLLCCHLIHLVAI